MDQSLLIYFNLQEMGQYLLKNLVCFTPSPYRLSNLSPLNSSAIHGPYLFGSISFLILRVMFCGSNEDQIYKIEAFYTTQLQCGGGIERS